MRTETPLQHDFATVVAAIRREFETLDRYLAAVNPAHWQGPTACREWNVQKVVSHLGSGAELHLRTLQTSLDGAEPVTDATRQSIWNYFDSLPPERLYPEFQARMRAYLGYLEGLPAEKREQRVRFFAGEAPVAEYAQYRLSELALHSWDIRVALDPTARLLPTTARANFPHALDTLQRRSNAAARAELAGTVYQFEVFGPVQRRFALAIRADGLEVREEAEAPTATLRLAAEAFLRLYTGRLPLPEAEEAGEVTLTGERAVALRLNTLFPGF
ncbi:MAG TPA: maleylpyruvate isomerase family mycothiol-dependent enzyme [Chloroflexota bacterium]|nr:maleylpyruvate isomerase family mycothiol-dependent enzyme [Chloroflexota bacterium]